jgi:acetamidase/formamidase
VEGALFSVGDGHAAQGDGEVGGIAIECSMERVDLTFSLLDNPPIRTPFAETSAGLITFGFDEDLDRAAMDALDAMLDLMVARGLAPDRQHALAVATVVVDMRVTQLVNQVRGVHAVLRSEVLLAKDAQ